MEKSSSSSKSRESATESPHPRFDSLADAETLRLFVERLDAGIYITDQEGRFLDANPAFLALFGLSSKDELADARVGDFLVEPERRSELLACWTSAAQRVRRQPELVRRDGVR